MDINFKNKYKLNHGCFLSANRQVSAKARMFKSIIVTPFIVSKLKIKYK